VNYKSSDFVKISLYSLNKLSYSSHKIIICDNFSSEKEKKRITKVCNCYSNVDLIFRRQTASGSIGHGEALDTLISKVTTPYFVVLDADAVFLMKNWDKLLLERMNDKVKIIGTQPPTGQTIKPTDFPLMYAIMIDTVVFKSLNIKMCPESLERASRGEDTGHQMRERFLNSGYDCELIRFKSTREFKEGPFKNMICGEFYLDGIDNIFVSHFGRGSSLGKAKYKSIQYKIPFIRKLKGTWEKRQWIGICKNIIEIQTLL
jgi:glycosyltransferase involved in cell wall biosynthesis